MATVPSSSAPKRKSESQGRSPQRKEFRTEPKDSFSGANVLKKCLQRLRELGSPEYCLEVVVNSILNAGVCSELGLNTLEMPVEEPTGSPSKDLLKAIGLANELRSNLAELCRSELEASSDESNHGETDKLIRSRKQAVQDGIEAPDPPDAAKISGLSAALANHPMKIGRPFETTGPPVSIYHPIFSRFQTLIQNQAFDPSPEDVVAAFDLIQMAVKVPRAGEGRMTHVKLPISDLLRRPIYGLPWARELKPDGLVLHHVRTSGPVPLLVMEVEDEIGTGGSDPDIEGSFSFRKLWTDESLTRVQNVCCCPSFILSMAGPNITIHGGVLATEFIVQPLTEMLKLANFPDPHGRAEYIAKIMAALRTCLDELEGFYNGLTLKAEEQPARFSPFFQEYDGFTLKYTSLNLLSDRVGRAMFNAKVKRSDEEEGSPVKVKFTPLYCKEAHTLLAEKKLAPKLRHFKELENGWKVVVMDSVAGPDLHYAKLATIPPRALKDVKEAVSMLHKENWVFGDLRRPNIMLCERDVPGGGTERGAMLVDFDWVGKDGKQRYPPGLNTDAIQWPTGVKKCGIMRKEHDVAMLELL